MPNFVVNHSRCKTTAEIENQMWERLITAIVLMWFTFVSALLSIAFDLIGSYCPRFLRWRKTSLKELEAVDDKITGALPCIKERKYVSVDETKKLWSVICNPDENGTPIIMVHGMGGGVGLWTMNLEALSKKRPVYAFDLLGFGRSSRPSFSKNPKEAEEMFVESIEGYRKAIGLEKFILMGHSLGGFLCASYSLRYPQYIKHLILVDPWGMNKQPPEGRSSLPLFVRVILSIMNMGYPMSILRALGPLGPRLVKRYRPHLAQTFAEKLGDESLLHQYIYHCNAQKPSGEAGFKSMTWNIGWAKEPMIQRMVDVSPQMPITFVFGAKSWVDRTGAWKFKDAHNGYVDVQILRGAGHHVYADRWDLFNTLICSIASYVDRSELPNLDKKLVQRIHAVPSAEDFQTPSPNDNDFQRPLGHGDENSKKESERSEVDVGNVRPGSEVC